MVALFLDVVDSQRSWWYWHVVLLLEPIQVRLKLHTLRPISSLSGFHGAKTPFSSLPMCSICLAREQPQMSPHQVQISNSVHIGNGTFVQSHVLCLNPACETSLDDSCSVFSNVDINVMTRRLLSY